MLLQRIGLEKFAPQLEANGYHTWHDVKTFEKETWKEQVYGLSEQEAVWCDVVNKGSEARPDLLRKFQIPEFMDLKRQLMLRFPSATVREGLTFARTLSDPLSSTSFSFFQVNNFLESVNSAEEAIQSASAIGSRLNSSSSFGNLFGDQQQDWVHRFLKNNDKIKYYGKFVKEEITTRELVCAAVTVEEDLQTVFEIKAKGARMSLFKAIQAEKKALEAENPSIKAETNKTQKEAD